MKRRGQWPDQVVWACHHRPTRTRHYDGGRSRPRPHPARPAFTLLGHEVGVTDALPALATPGDLLLCDMSCYLVGDRQRVDIAASPHPSFLSNQTLWRFTSRVAGQPRFRDKLTLADGSTVSPFVAHTA
ncbi:MAG: phage major capsid protein [Gemmataceae bacterium]|nr:phage major capsid protein [Gemmataceae bacterium]